MIIYPRFKSYAINQKREKVICKGEDITYLFWRIIGIDIHKIIIKMFLIKKVL
jgi:hypothetical protein